MFPYPLESKFEVFKQDVPTNEYFAKYVDERTFFSVFNKVADFEYLDGVRGRIDKAIPRLRRSESSFLDMFRGEERLVDIKSKFIRWKLDLGAEDMYATLLDVPGAEDNDRLGLNTTPFDILLDADIYGHRDTLTFGDWPEFNVLVQSNYGKPYGDGYLYSVTIEGNSDYTWPGSDVIEIGSRVTQTGGLRAEAAIDRANVSFTMGESFVEYEVPQTRQGWDMKITDDAWLASSSAMIVAYPTGTSDADIATGNAEAIGPGIIANEVDVKFKDETDRHIDMRLIYGRSMNTRFKNAQQDNLTGRDFETGPGMYEFMDHCRRTEYNPEMDDLDMLTARLGPEWNDRVPIEDRKTKLYGGSAAKLWWSKITKKAQDQGFLLDIQLNENIAESIAPNRKAVSINAREIKSVFLEPFGEIEFIYLPFLDSETIDNRKWKGWPVRSYLMFTMGQTSETGVDSNVYMTNNSAQEQMGYNVNLWGPTGAVLSGGNSIAHGTKENAYSIVRDTANGMVVKNMKDVHMFAPVFLR